MSNEAGPLGIERLENLEDYIEDILQKKTLMVRTNDIALLASKKGFNVDKERALVAKANVTKCSCRHYRPLSNGVCTFRNCRHGQTHNTVGLVR